MSYRAGCSIHTALAMNAPELAGVPRIVCDNCGLIHEVPSLPPVRFLRRQRGWPKGWLVTFSEFTRYDLCPRCRPRNHK
jgi:hypothetical protein